MLLVHPYCFGMSCQVLEISTVEICLLLNIMEPDGTLYQKIIDENRGDKNARELKTRGVKRVVKWKMK